MTDVFFASAFDCADAGLEEDKMASVIETKQLTKRYGTFTALEHVDLHVRKGCIYGLVGDNGAGKSTLLKLLAGQSFPTEGEIRLLGEFEPKALDECRGNMGFMIEQPGFFPNMTVEQTLTYYAIQKGIPERARVGEALELTGLSGKRRNKCAHLSMGQKQRLGLAIAMLGAPQVLVLDEPINGLDPSGIIEFRNILHQLNREKNITILISSHILSELEQTADVYGFLNRGVLLEEISAQSLREKCVDRVEITLSDIEKYAAVFERAFPDKRYQILPDHSICIEDPGEDMELYSRLALEHQIYITQMKTIQSSLEEYYMELKKRGV